VPTLAHVLTLPGASLQPLDEIAWINDKASVRFLPNCRRFASFGVSAEVPLF
jgi:hypothetical protein